MSRLLSLDELLSEKKAQVSKPEYVAPIVEDAPKAEDVPVIEDTPKAEDVPVIEDTHVIEDTPIVEDAPKAEDTPVKPTKKGGKKAAVEA